MSKQPPPAPTASAVGPHPTLNQTSRTPQHRKLTQHHHTTRPPPTLKEKKRLTHPETYSLLNPSKPQTRIAADDILIFYFYLSKKIRLDFSSESSGKQRIHLKHQVLFSLKNNEKIFMNVVCCSHDWRFKG